MVSKSSQKFTFRNRAPSVRLEYEVQTGDGEKKVELPFLIGVMADIAGNSGAAHLPLAERELVEVPGGDFDAFMKILRPGVRFSVENVLTGGDMEVDLDFESLDDFLPGAIAGRIPQLSELMKRPAPESSPKDARSQQLNLILHHPELMKLEGAWRGLHYLATNALAFEMVRIRVLPMSKEELLEEAQSFTGDSWSRSTLSGHFCEEPMSRPGEPLFGCLIGDFEFDHSPRDVEALEFMMRIAAGASAPFWAAASPALFHVEAWSEFGYPREITSRPREYTAWSRLRDEADSRFVGLALPRFLARSPYGRGEHRYSCPGIEFEEDLDAGDGAELVWANPAYLCGVIAARAFDRYRWFAHITGIESGGEIEGLPCYPAPMDTGDINPQSALEMCITERREMQLSRFGLMPFMARKYADFTFILSFSSICKPVEYDDHRATAMAHMAGRFKYHLNLCRVVLYLKSIARDLHTSFGSAGELERYLNEWLGQYGDTHPEVSAEHEMRQRPLAAAEVTLSTRDGEGSIAVKLWCQPNYQLEGLTAPLPIRFRIPDYWAQ